MIELVCKETIHVQCRVCYQKWMEFSYKNSNFRDLEKFLKDFSDFFDPICTDCFEKAKEANPISFHYDSDIGHTRLIETLKWLLRAAENFEFHDLKNQKKKYATPKMKLREKFLELANNVDEGLYDNL